jgi:HD-GYP domain-containing protein (c-di-GMP phosphodiesterase class II)
MIEDHDCAWLYWCRGLTLERWWEECRLVEERFSLFQSFAEPPFFGFRGPQLWLKVGDWPSKRKDPGTWGHCKRVAAFATVLAHALKLDDEEVRAIA